jgi:hypothetical protein
MPRHPAPTLAEKAFIQSLQDAERTANRMLDFPDGPRNLDQFHRFSNRVRAIIEAAVLGKTA